MDANEIRSRRSRLVWLLLAAWLVAPSAAALGQAKPNLLTPPPRTSSAPATVGTTGEAANTRPSLLPPPGTLPAFGKPVAAAAAATAPALAPSATPPRDAAQPRDASPTFTADSRAIAPSGSSGGGLKVNKGTGVLPNDHGQVWREYDISAYTSGLDKVERPEQAVIDWVLRETGTEVWFGEPLGILSAGPTVLRVYHTPEMQQKVQGIVERLVASGADSHVLTVRLMTVGSPNWRARAVSLVQPVDVKSPGVEAWLLSRENAALLYDQLRQRGDFREHSAPQVQIPSGQTQSLARRQPRQYSRGVQMKKTFPFYDLIPGQIEEGYSLEISPLMSLDGRSVEAALECEVDQVEKLVPVNIDIPIGGQSQRVQIQVPQMVSWRVTERFRWPADQVLLLSCGVVANPAGAADGPLAGLLAPIGAATSRADALLFVEQRGTASELAKTGGDAAVNFAPVAQPTGPTQSLRNLFRY